VVLLGGGEYACVFANASYAMDSLGADGSLVTSTRPMSLKDTPLNPLRNFQWYVYVRVRRYCFVFFYCMYEFETNIVIVAIYSLWHIDVYIFTKTHHFHPISTLVNSRLSWHLNWMYCMHCIRSQVNAMPLAVGDDELGFSEALGTCDSVVDTLWEMKHDWKKCKTCLMMALIE